MSTTCWSTLNWRGVHSSKASRRAEQQKIRKAAHYKSGVSKDFAFKVHRTTCIKIIQNEP